jgi:hypothetical protein
MDSLERFCATLLAEGRAVFSERPMPPAGDATATAAVLAEAFAAERRSIAGPPIAFDPALACAAAEVVRQACWGAVCHDEASDAIRGRLALHGPPRTASQHASADLTLRYLPQVLRRLRAVGPADPLAGFLGDLLRQWPLSGVLSDVRQAPTTPLEFGGHDGLMLLYAERLARHPKGAWVPRGRPREYAGLVFQELGLELPAHTAEVTFDA